MRGGQAGGGTFAKRRTSLDRSNRSLYRGDISACRASADATCCVLYDGFACAAGIGSFEERECQGFDTVILPSIHHHYRHEDVPPTRTIPFVFFLRLLRIFSLIVPEPRFFDSSRSVVFTRFQFA